MQSHQPVSSTLNIQTRHQYLLYALCIKITVTLFIDHLRSSVIFKFGQFCMYVCLSVCQTITSERLHVGSSYLHIRYISRQYGSLGRGLRSQDRKRSTTGTHANTRNAYLQCAAAFLSNESLPNPLHHCCGGAQHHRSRITGTQAESN